MLLSGTVMIVYCLFPGGQGLCLYISSAKTWHMAGLPQLFVEWMSQWMKTLWKMSLFAFSNLQLPPGLEIILYSKTMEFVPIDPTGLSHGLLSIVSPNMDRTVLSPFEIWELQGWVWALGISGARSRQLPPFRFPAVAFPACGHPEEVPFPPAPILKALPHVLFWWWLMLPSFTWSK